MLANTLLSMSSLIRFLKVFDVDKWCVKHQIYIILSRLYALELRGLIHWITCLTQHISFQNFSHEAHMSNFYVLSIGLISTNFTAYHFLAP